MLSTVPRLVVIESPFAGDVETNLAYVRACMADCLAQGESPFASHALYTQPGVLDDDDPEERHKGMMAGWDWMTKADAVVVYTDLGISQGMRDGIERASKAGKPIEFRTIGGGWG